MAESGETLAEQDTESASVRGHRAETEGLEIKRRYFKIQGKSKFYELGMNNYFLDLAAHWVKVMNIVVRDWSLITGRGGGGYKTGGGGQVLSL